MTDERFFRSLSAASVEAQLKIDAAKSKGLAKEAEYWASIRSDLLRVIGRQALLDSVKLA